MHIRTPGVDPEELNVMNVLQNTTIGYFKGLMKLHDFKHFTTYEIPTFLKLPPRQSRWARHFGSQALDGKVSESFPMLSLAQSPHHLSYGYLT